MIEMLDELVKSVIRTEIVTVDETSSIFDAGREMANNQVGAVIVIDAEKNPVGILTERDFLHSTITVIDEGSRLQEAKVTDYMSEPVISINAEASIKKAAEKMYDKAIRRLLIVDDNGQAIGFCSLKDILEATNDALNEL